MRDQKRAGTLLAYVQLAINVVVGVVYTPIMLHYLGDSEYGNNAANRELRCKYQALCAWELTMPEIKDPAYASLSRKVFYAPKPWYYAQILDGTLK